MTNYARNLANAGQRKQNTQLEVIPGREADMAQNAAGGVSFVLNDWDVLDRFLILGSEGGTYYATEQKLTKDNAKHVLKLLAMDGTRVVNRVVEISDAGRAPKNDPALFVLAMASADSNPMVRQAALAALPKVARIGTHLFHYAAFVDGMRGWGRALKRAVANWYLEMPVERLAEQVVKYQSRDGWSNRDMLRLSHPETGDMERDAILRWVTGGVAALSSTEISRKVKGEMTTVARPDITTHLPLLIQAFEQAKTADEATVIKLITDHNLPREAIPTQHLNSVKVWEALLERMPMTAMIRNLAKMTNVGLITNMGDAERKVRDQLGNVEALKRARVHPIQLLSALLTYQRGAGIKGKLTWSPNQRVVDALDKAFYASFANVTPTGRNTLLALDVSGSMGGGEIAGVPGLTPRVGSAAMALITANVESNYEFIGFTGGSGGYWGGRTGNPNDVKVLKISPRQRLDDVVKTISGLPFGGTDVALPMLWAKHNKVPVQDFAVYTDNESWAGYIQPAQALVQYRNETGIAAKVAFVGMTATHSTCGDTKDAGTLDVVGFDTNTPAIMADFFRK